MGKVKFDMSLSLDGFVAGPNDEVDRLHEWVYDLASWRERHGLSGGKADQDSEVLDEAFRNTGAMVMGKRMFDLGVGPWGENPPFHVPVFVVTHTPRERIARGGTTFIFVTGGIESALEQAKAAAGGRDISIAGGADVLQQYLKAGLIDEFEVDVVPVLLGSGIRLFDHLGTDPIELECIQVIKSPGVTHLRYRVRKKKQGQAG